MSRLLIRNSCVDCAADTLVTAVRSRIKPMADDEFYGDIPGTLRLAACCRHGTNKLPTKFLKVTLRVYRKLMEPKN